MGNIKRMQANFKKLYKTKKNCHIFSASNLFDIVDDSLKTVKQ